MRMVRCLMCLPLWPRLSRAPRCDSRLAAAVLAACAAMSPQLSLPQRRARGRSERRPRRSRRDLCAVRAVAGTYAHVHGSCPRERPLRGADRGRNLCTCAWFVALVFTVLASSSSCAALRLPPRSGGVGCVRGHVPQLFLPRHRARGRSERRPRRSRRDLCTVRTVEGTYARVHGSLPWCSPLWPRLPRAPRCDYRRQRAWPRLLCSPSPHVRRTATPASKRRCQQQRVRARPSSLAAQRAVSSSPPPKRGTFSSSDLACASGSGCL